MKTRKAAALPTAVALCSFLLIISFVVSSLIVQMSLINKLTVKEGNRDLLFSKANNLFIKNNGDISSLTDETYRWETYEGENDLKALVAYKKDGYEIVFYTIYDFDSGKTLAYQNGVTYLEDDHGVTVLGGLVRIEE